MASNPLGMLDSTIGGIDLVPVSPSDTEDLARAARALRCRPDGSPGTLRITTRAGIVRNTYIGPGDHLWCSVIKVHASGTTATQIEALI